MTITSAIEIWSGQTSEDEETGARTYEALWRIISDTPTESILNVKAAVPLITAPYVYDPAATATSRSFTRRSDTREVWEATITYEFNPEDPDDPQENPLNDPAEIEWVSNLELEPVLKDRSGNAVVNSAGDYFDPPPEFDIARWTANVQKNVASVPTDILTWAGAILNAPYLIDGVSVEADKSRIIALSISKQQEKNDIPFRTVTMGIKFYRDEVMLSLLDQGYRKIDVNGQLVDILIGDDSGTSQRASAPVLLDGNGDELSAPTPESAVFIDFDPPVESLNPSLIATLLV